MTVKEVTVKNVVGLHARPATLFVIRANMYNCTIWVQKGERRVNGKDLIGILCLGIIGGDIIKIITDKADFGNKPNDEKEALEYLVRLIDTEFKEEYELWGIPN